MAHLVSRFLTVVLVFSISACTSDKDPVGAGGGGGGGGGGAAGIRVMKSANTGLIVANLDGTPIHLCTENRGLSINMGLNERERSGAGKMLLLKALFCIQQPIQVTFCLDEWDMGLRPPGQPTDGTMSSLTFLPRSISSESQCSFRVVLSKSNFNAIFADRSPEGMMRRDAIIHGSIIAINQNTEDLISNLLVRVDQSLLADAEIVRFNESDVFFGGLGLDEGMALWDYKFSKIHIQVVADRIKDYFRRRVITVESMCDFVINKLYDKIKKFGHRTNVNTYSREKKPIGKEDITTYGLSPLMVAAILGDEEAINALKEVSGINLNYVSPLLRGNYSVILSREFNYGRFSLAQRGWSHNSPGSGGYGSGGGSAGGGGASGGAGGGGSSAGSAGVTTRVDLPKSACPGCTAVMVAIKQGNCAEVKSIVDGEPSAINALGAKNVSPIMFSINNGENCLRELFELGSDPRLSNVLFGWVRRGNMTKLDMIPASFWEKFTSADKKKYIEMILTSTYHVSIQDAVQLAKKYTQFSQEDIRTVIDELGFRKIIWLREAAYAFMAEVGVDLNEFKDKSGLTVFDHYLRERGEYNHYENGISKKYDRFETRLRTIMRIQPHWLTTWVNGFTFYGYNPLVLSAAYYEDEVVSQLLEIPSVNANVVDQKMGFSALDWAYYHMTVVSYMGFGGDWTTVEVSGDGIADALRAKNATEERTVRESQQSEHKQKMEERLQRLFDEFKQIRSTSNPTPFNRVGDAVTSVD